MGAGRPESSIILPAGRSIARSLLVGLVLLTSFMFPESARATGPPCQNAPYVQNHFSGRWNAGTAFVDSVSALITVRSSVFCETSPALSFYSGWAMIASGGGGGYAQSGFDRTWLSPDGVGCIRQFSQALIATGFTPQSNFTNICTGVGAQHLYTTMRVPTGNPHLEMYFGFTLIQATVWDSYPW